jgi:hypothetical protein
MSQRTLNFTKWAAAVGAVASVFGFISIQSVASAAAATVFFVAAIYFFLRKPDISS